MPAPTKQRPGDQRLPTINDRPCVQDVVIETMQESKRVGLERYGTVMQPMNGRDTLLDAGDEARDLLVYLTAYQMERAEMADRLERVIIESLIPLGDALPLVAGQEIAAVLSWLRGEPVDEA